MISIEISGLIITFHNTYIYDAHVIIFLVNEVTKYFKLKIALYLSSGVYKSVPLTYSNISCKDYRVYLACLHFYRG